MAMQLTFPQDPTGCTPVIKVEEKEEIIKRGVPLQELFYRVQEINVTADWCHHDRSIGEYLKKRDVVFLFASEKEDVDLQDVIKGYAIVKFPHPDVAEIPYIATAEKGKGIGTVLMKAAIAKSKEKSCRSITWDCRPKVRGFYTRFAENEGLTLIQSPDGKYFNGDSRTHMRLDIQARGLAPEEISIAAGVEHLPPVTQGLEMDRVVSATLSAAAGVLVDSSYFHEMTGLLAEIEKKTRSFGELCRFNKVRGERDRTQEPFEASTLLTLHAIAMRLYLAHIFKKEIPEEFTPYFLDGNLKDGLTHIEIRDLCREVENQSCAHPSTPLDPSSEHHSLRILHENLTKCGDLESSRSKQELATDIDQLDQKLRIFVAKIHAEKGADLSTYIERYNIEDEQACIEIAKIAAYEHVSGVCSDIKNYRIADRKALFEIAKIIANKSFRSLSKCRISDFGIEEERDRFEICIRGSRSDPTAIWGAFFGLSRYELSPQAEEIVKLHHAMECSLIPEFIEEGKEFLKLNLDQAIELLTKEDCPLQHIRKAILNDKEKRPLAFPLNALIFQYLNKVCAYKRIGVNEMMQKGLCEIMKYRNPRDKFFLAQSLINNSTEPYERYSELVSCQTKGKESESKQKHLYLPMVMISKWVSEGANLEKAQKIREFLLQYQNFAHQMPLPFTGLLQAQICVEKCSGLSSDQKMTLFERIIDLLKTRGNKLPDEGREFSEIMSIISSLALSNMLKPGCRLLDSSTEPFSLQGLRTFSQKQLKEILGLTLSVENLVQKWRAIDETQRVPQGLMTYFTRLKGLNEERLVTQAEKMLTAILDGNVREARYGTVDHPHLLKISREHPVIFEGWKNLSGIVEGSRASSAAAEMTREPKAFDFKVFLVQKIITDNHYPEASIQLRQFLQNPSEEPILEGLEEDDRKILSLCRELCKQPINSIGSLKVLSGLVPKECEFSNDLESLQKGLQAPVQDRAFAVVNTDDWQDLFLSGTEVSGSCQRIDGDASLNKCLMAYVMDGKNRLIAIKDPNTGKILARSILRLLLNKHDQPVLFQERIYPDYVSPEYHKGLNEAALAAASHLGIPLFTINERADFGTSQIKRTDLDTSQIESLRSLGSTVPYEYVDALAGKTNGEFTIIEALRVKES